MSRREKISARTLTPSHEFPTTSSSVVTAQMMRVSTPAKQLPVAPVLAKVVDGIDAPDGTPTTPHRLRAHFRQTLGVVEGREKYKSLEKKNRGAT